MVGSTAKPLMTSPTNNFLMRYAKPGANDDVKYLEWVESIITGIVQTIDPDQLAPVLVY
jgi:hypothetical protein